MNFPLVTVFMPVYNCEKYIRQSIESILNQTYKNIDLLIIDDGSTDNSIEIIKSYNDSRIRLLCNDKNEGIPYTRRRGIENARGEYFALMDADDISHPQRIYSQVMFLNENIDTDVVCSYYKTFGRKINRIFKSYNRPEENKIGLLFHNPIGNPTAMIRLNSLNKNNIKYNKDYFVAQDYDLWAQISKCGCISTIPKVLLKYRVGHENITKKTQTKKRLERKKVIDKIHNELLDYYNFNLNDFEKNIFNNLFDDNDMNLLEEKEITNMRLLIKKLNKINLEKKIFEHLCFSKIMNDRILKRINSCKINIKSKIVIYISLIDDNFISRLKNIFLIVIRYIYCYFI